MEDQRQSAWVSQVLDKQRCHFVGFVRSTYGSASNKGGNDESILDTLNPDFGDSDGYASGIHADIC